MDEFRDDLRFESLRALLALDDPPDLPRRRHLRTYAGDPVRKDHIKWALAAAYVAYRMQMHGQQDGIIGVTRFPLRLLKKTA